MSNRPLLENLSIPNKKSNLADIDDATEKPTWGDEAPSSFAAPIGNVSPNKKKKMTVEALTKKNGHVDPVVAKESELEAVSKEDAYWAAQGAMPLIDNDESEMVHKDTSMMGEQSPTMEDDNISPCFSNFGGEAADYAGKPTAQDELGVENFGNDSDSGSEYNASNCKNDLETDPMYMNKSLASDFADHSARENTSDVSNNLFESATKNTTEASQSREPDIHQDCQKCVSLREDVISRDKEIAELKAQIAAFTNKAVSSVDACMNTETPSEQDWHPSHPRERNIEWQASTSNPLSLSSLPLPLVTTLSVQTTAAQFIQICLDMAKRLYLVLVNLICITLQPAQELFPSYVCGSIPLKEKAFLFKDSVKATILCMATPICFAINLALFLDMHQEKETWMQANSLSRKHFLKHVSGESSLFWELLVTIGRLGITY